MERLGTFRADLGSSWWRFGRLEAVLVPFWVGQEGILAANGGGGGASFAIMGRVGSSLGESEVGFLYQDGARVPVNNLPLYESNILKRLSE